MKKIFVLFLFFSQLAFAQKNQIGLTFSPTISGIKFKKDFGPPIEKAYNPYSSSFSINYARNLKGKFWLQGGIGLFNYKEKWKYDYSKIVYSSIDPSFSNPYFETNTPYINISLQPKFIFGKKIIGVAGISYSLNNYGSTSLWGGLIGGIGYKYNSMVFLLEPEFQTKYINFGTGGKSVANPYVFFINTSVKYCF